MKLLLALLAVTWPVAVAAQSRVEDIYIARSVLESSVPPTAYCTPARTGFDNSTNEDRYGLQSIATRPSDGLITDDNVNTIGNLRACFASTADPKTRNFYAEGTLSAVSFIGAGECLTVKPDYPEPGVNRRLRVRAVGMRSGSARNLRCRCPGMASATRPVCRVRSVSRKAPSPTWAWLGVD